MVLPGLSMSMHDMQYVCNEYKRGRQITILREPGYHGCHVVSLDYMQNWTLFSSSTTGIIQTLHKPSRKCWMESIHISLSITCN